MDNSKAFQTLWAAAERRFTDQYVCADTLYCVAGCYFADENDGYDCRKTPRTTVYEFAFERVHHADAPFQEWPCPQRQPGGKPIQECSAGELKAVGFWFENADDKGSTAPTLQLGIHGVGRGDRKSRASPSSPTFPPKPSGNAPARLGDSDPCDATKRKRSCYCSSFLGGTVSGRSEGRQSQRDADRRTHTRSIG